jgi:HAD superfamily hydrolase (TIGR01509 family)
MNFEAIIFDCDGTLVDSERLGNQVLAEFLGELGFRTTTEECMARFKGRRMAETVRLIEELLGRPVPRDFVPEAHRRMETLFTAELRAIDGVESLLQSLDIPFCVASNGPRDKMEASLDATGLLPYFRERIFSAYEVGSWKPEPGLFLHAAKTLGVRPERCAVVEDSLVGATAGVAAGMTVFAFAPAEGGEDFESAGARPFARMAELPPLWCGFD